MKQRIDRRRWLRTIVISLLCLVLGWLGSSYLVARYFVSRRMSLYVEKLPKIDGMHFTEHRLQAQDGETIGSWFDAGPAHGPIVVLVHGHMGDRSQCLSRARLFHELGCGVMLITMRAHGDSTGEMNDFGYGGKYDVMAAVQFVKQQAPGRPILLVGISAGAAAVCFAAEKLGHDIQGCVMEQPYRDMRTVVRRRVDLFLPAVLSDIAYLGLLTTGKWVLSEYDNISPYQAATGIATDVPIWILAGGRDNRARPEEAQAIYEQASSHSELVVFNESGHESLLDHDPVKYRGLAKKWVERLKAVQPAK